MPYFEVSAQNGDNIDKAFDKIAVMCFNYSIAETEKFMEIFFKKDNDYDYCNKCNIL